MFGHRKGAMLALALAAAMTGLASAQTSSESVYVTVLHRHATWSLADAPWLDVTTGGGVRGPGGSGGQAAGALLAAVASGAAPDAAGRPADRVVFADGTFLPGDWVLEVLKTKAISSVSVAQRGSGGNPGAYRRVLHQVAPGSGAAPSQVMSLHKHLPAVYDPGTQGPIDRLCYSEDAFILDGFGEGQNTGAALWQGGQAFILSIGPTFMPPDWLRRASPALGAADFVAVLPTTALDRTRHPDFSAAGAAITFGFFRSNTSRNTGWSLDGAIDNWQVEVNCDLGGPTATVTSTPSPAPTASPNPTASRTPTPTPTPSSTPTASATATVTSTSTGPATWTPSPVPSATPTDPVAQCVPVTTAADIVLVLDRSSSMLDAGKLRDATAAVLSFVEMARMPPDQLALVTFANVAGLAHPLTVDKARLRSAVQGTRTGTGTRIDLGLAAARNALAGTRHDSRRGRVVVLLTDGVQNGVPASAVLDQAVAAKADGIVLYTIGLGPDADLALLRQAATSPGHAFVAPTGADLADLYRRISVAIPCSSLGGQVYVDRDGDGRYDPSADAALAAAVVQLTGPVARRARSEASGRPNYRFDDLPGGSYTVALDLATVPMGFVPGSPVSQVVDLAATPRQDVDFGLRRAISTPTRAAPAPAVTPSATPEARSRLFLPIGDS